MQVQARDRWAALEGKTDPPALEAWNDDRNEAGTPELPLH